MEGEKWEQHFLPFIYNHPLHPPRSCSLRCRMSQRKIAEVMFHLLALRCGQAVEAADEPVDLLVGPGSS